MKILVTGAAGFIGAALVKALMTRGEEIVGLDNINDYYTPELKLARLADAGIDGTALREGETVQSHSYAGYRFVRMDLTDRLGMEKLFAREHFDIVVNLAGQPGVRYSLENPFSYVESNVIGFLNLLENCRHHPVRHLVYASSSSIYGMNNKVPYSEDDKTDRPVSLYAATKKSDELMAYAYSKLYRIPATGMRFFTVYGPWGRPDMAPALFLSAILEGRPIHVFNHGEMQRDFTYIDDIIEGLLLVLDHPSEEEVPHRVYNVGHSTPVELMDFIHEIEAVAGKEAVMEMEGMQPGDVSCTYADITHLREDFGYSPRTSLHDGIRAYYDWYRRYTEQRD